MNKSLLILLSLLLFGFAVNAQSIAANKSLIVSYCDKKSGNCNIEHIEKLDFSNGRLISRKRIVSLKADKEGLNLGLIENRYLQTVNDKYFDVVAEKFVTLPENSFKNKSDYSTSISPDGRKKAVFDGFNQASKLEIQQQNEPPIIIDASFEATVKKISNQIPNIPIVWIDNERILTQNRNGNLVIVTLDGKVSPFLELPCGEKNFPELKKSKAGKIIYRCDGDEYVIDVANQKFNKSRRDLDNDFFADFENRSEIYYYKENKIGIDGINPLSTENYLAVLFGEAKNDFIDMGEIKQINVWNSLTKKWLKLTVDGWSANIIGWIE